jgi:uncharacterized protein
MPNDVFHLPVNDRCLLVSPLRRIAAAVNRAGVDYVRRALSAAVRGEAATEPGPLQELAAELSVPCTEPEPQRGPVRPPFLGLVLTRGCNMACRYCNFASGDASETMSEELAGQAVAAWARWLHEAGGQRLELHFFGGEPFTQPDLIEIAVHAARLAGGRYGMPLHVEASTNGLWNRRMLRFVADHFSAVVLSLDGEAEDHDRHRPLYGGRCSFRRVWETARALADSPVELCLRACISSANVAAMPRTARRFCDALGPRAMAFEAMRAGAEARAAGLRPPAPLEFARGFVAAWREGRRAGVECVYAPLCDRPQLTFCPVGRDAFIVAPDRSVRSCYLRRKDWQAAGLDMQIGRVAADGELCIDQAAVERLRATVARRARCRRCFCRWTCAGGCIVSETPPGHDPRYTDFCRQTRLIQACVLLEQLDMSEHVDRLLVDETAVACLWEHADDRLERSAIYDNV